MSTNENNPLRGPWTCADGVTVAKHFLLSNIIERRALLAKADDVF